MSTWRVPALRRQHEPSPRIPGPAETRRRPPGPPPGRWVPRPERAAARAVPIPRGCRPMGLPAASWRGDPGGRSPWSGSSCRSGPRCPAGPCHEGLPLGRVAESPVALCRGVALKSPMALKSFTLKTFTPGVPPSWRSKGVLMALQTCPRAGLRVRGVLGLEARAGAAPGVRPVTSRGRRPSPLAPRTILTQGAPGGPRRKGLPPGRVAENPVSLCRGVALKPPMALKSSTLKSFTSGSPCSGGPKGF